MSVSLSKTIARGTYAGATEVDLGPVKVVTLGAKELKNYADVISKNNWDDKDPKMNIYDYKRMTDSFQINGILTDTSGGIKAMTKKNQIIAMCEDGGNSILCINVTTGSDSYTSSGSENYSINFLTYSFENDDTMSGTNRFKFQLNLLAGSIR